MCLGIPMQVKSADQYQALCEAKGIERTVSLLMLQDEKIISGDYLVIHSGHAIQKISPEEAQSAWDIYDQMLAVDDLPGAATGDNSDNSDNEDAEYGEDVGIEVRRATF